MASFPFASAYAPVDALATRQMQINAAEQARQIEMQRMAQIERQAQLGAALQARQLQDAQASREMQAALSFRQQAAVEAQNRAVMQDAAATRTAQLGFNEKDLSARQQMLKDQLSSAEKIADITSKRTDPQSLRWNIESNQAKMDLTVKAAGAASQANAILDKAVEDEFIGETSALRTFPGGMIPFVDSRLEQARQDMAKPEGAAKITARRKALKAQIESRISPDVLGLIKWNETTFKWESAFEPEVKSAPAKVEPPVINPFLGTNAPPATMPGSPTATAPVIVAPRMQTPPVTTAPFAGFSGQLAIPQNPAFEVFPGSSRIPETPGWTPFPGQRITTKETVYRPTTDAEFEAVPEGARFVNPRDGLTYTKNKKASAK